MPHWWHWEARSCWIARVAPFDRAVELEPNSVMALNNLAWLLATCPDPAVCNGSRARQLSSEDNLSVLRTRAAALAERGCLAEAVAVAEQGLQKAQDRSERPAAESFQRQLAVFRAGRAYREVP